MTSPVPQPIQHQPCDQKNRHADRGAGGDGLSTRHHDPLSAGCAPRASNASADVPVGPPDALPNADGSAGTTSLDNDRPASLTLTTGDRTWECAA